MTIIYDPETGAYIDEKTGEVIGYAVINDDGRIYDADDFLKKAKHGGVHSYVHDYGLTTDIDTKSNTSRPSIAKKYSNYQKNLRLKRLNKIVRASTGDEKLMKWLELLNQMCARIKCSYNDKEFASRILRRLRVLEKNGEFPKKVIRNPEAVYYIASAIISAFRVHGKPLTMSEVCNIFELDRVKLFRAMEEMSSVGLMVKFNAPIEALITRTVSILNLPFDVEKLALELCSLLKRWGRHEGRMPQSMAGACIYLASKLSDIDIPMVAIADQLDITESAIRHTLRYMLNHLDIEVIL